MAGVCQIDNTEMSQGSFIDRQLPWFAIRVREKLRTLTEQHLAAKDVLYFSPVTTEVRQWSDRTKNIMLPLFAGYLFCQFELTRQIEILTTPGVIDIVKSGSRLAEVDPFELDDIARVTRVCVFAEALPYLVPGQRVRVIYGPLIGIEGILVDQRTQFKLVLAVSMMNRSVAVQIDRAHVTPI